MTKFMGLNQLSDEEFLFRRRELEAMAHGLIASGVPMMARDQAEYDALGEEMQRRHTEPSSKGSRA